ncbi:hypothetical protein A5886_000973 [Enterococcus sp. 8G7_MSG3316]|uniref:Uncharacterized protein n=1 Tax=Candidatus Enterococcus testudinis TaxID=1834191 RepID=A0A242A4C8_9ENTE|nr:hypothetical protein [Enterococcus sp. 8G7_MSG3316]OTN75897.1 hypothetical protein A5886_000973 [Enterococcus sp. 8G7_MSG3316]
MSVTNNDSRTLTVKKVRVDDGSFWSSDYTQERLERDGINTTIYSGNRWGVALSHRIGWDMDELKVIVTVETESGVTKELVYYV